MLFLILLVLLINDVTSMIDHEERQIILTAHGMSIDDVENRVIIPIQDGHIPPLPCVMANAGTHQHGETFTNKNFHYQCHNGTAEVVACIADDQSVIQLGRTFIKNGMKHKCSIAGDSVTYEQESMCFDNGVHYSIGDTFRNGSFRLTCGRDGIIIEGCHLQDSMGYLIAGESRIVGRQRHECEVLGDGRVRYQIKIIGCVRDSQHYSIGQVFTDKHVRYQCKNDGSLDVLGCVDDGVFLDLGRDLLMNGMVYRCYQVDTTTIYHKFTCVIDILKSNRSIHQSINAQIGYLLVKSAMLRRRVIKNLYSFVSYVQNVQNQTEPMGPCYDSTVFTVDHCQNASRCLIVHVLDVFIGDNLIRSSTDFTSNAIANTYRNQQ